MRTAWIAALAIALNPLFAHAASAPDPESGQGRAEDAGRALIGKPGPALTLRTIDGQRIDLAKLYGKKPVYLKFWATWCTPCRAQMPAFEKDYETLGDKVQVVAVNIGFNDSVAAVKDLRQRLGLKMPIVFDDGALGGALNLRVTPQHVVVGRDGRILYVGHEEDERLHQAFAQALAEPPRAVAVTRAVAVRPASAVDAPRVLGGAGEAALKPFAGPAAAGPPRAVVFMSAFCESYLATRAPERAANCKQMREALDQAIAAGQLRAVGVASGIWTTQKDLEAYRKVDASMPMVLDASGALFRAFGVRDGPTVILLDARGRVAGRVAPGGDLAAALQAMKAVRS